MFGSVCSYIYSYKNLIGLSSLCVSVLSYYVSIESVVQLVPHQMKSLRLLSLLNVHDEPQEAVLNLLNATDIEL